MFRVLSAAAAASACFVCLLGPVAHAAESGAAVVVTASRLSEDLDAALSSVTVIERADIERLQVRSIDELLRGVTGISIARQGGMGQPTSLYMRGGESDHVLWLIDGVRIGSVSAGIPALQDLPIESIERIEIVRGVRSSLYGPDAMGGVVQIFTRRAAAAPHSLRMSAGSNGTRQAAASLGAGEAAWRADLQLSHLETDGTNACLGAPFPPGGGCFTNEPDRDPYENTSINLRLSHRGDSSSTELFVQRSEADVAFDGSFLNRSDLVNQVAGFRWQSDLRAGWRSTLTLGRSWDESTSFSPTGSFTSTFDSTRDSASWQSDLETRHGTWVVGVDWLRDRVSSDVGFERDSRSNQALFTQYSTVINAWTAGLSLRHDDNEQFGSELTGNMGLGYRFESGLQIYGNVGTAFKAPSFNELYYPGFSNPDLEPERSLGMELGVKQRRTWGRWSLAAFRHEVDDLVAFDVATFRPNNIASARLGGLEGELAWLQGAWRLEQSVTWLQAEDRSAGTVDRKLPRRPEWSGKTSVHWQSNSLQLGTSVNWAARRYDDLANTRELGSYATVDLTADWQATRLLALQLRVANAFDRAYELATWYPALGREVFLSVRYSAPR